MSSSFGVAGGGQDVKLTETEQKLVARLFSDPTYFPVEFRTWLKNYIESAGITVTASQVQRGASVNTGLPPGCLVTAASVACLPPDCLQCNGQAVSRANYQQLFSKLGTTWGVGDGSTTFNVPDLRDRTMFHAGSAVGVAATDSQAYGSRGGPRHNHGSHDHGSHQHVFGREAVSLTPGGTAYSTLGGMVTHDVATDMATVPAALVGPGGTLQDAPNWAGVVVGITTGQ